jgi:EAL domain-containing protein (putative c-di-GMP-specific phosphodiesterase class I)
MIRELGYPAAFVAQDGIEKTEIPWDAFDVLFIGGSTDFKLGQIVRDVVSMAKEKGKWVHMGRVNSQKRLEYATGIGCDSADGTYLIFGPTKNLPNVLSWLRKVNNQDSMFVGEV